MICTRESLIIHVWVSPRVLGDVRFLDRLRRRPAQIVMRSTRLVVRACNAHRAFICCRILPVSHGFIKPVWDGTDASSPDMNESTMDFGTGRADGSYHCPTHRTFARHQTAVGRPRCPCIYRSNTNCQRHRVADHAPNTGIFCTFARWHQSPTTGALLVLCEHSAGQSKRCGVLDRLEHAVGLCVGVDVDR